MCAIKSTNLLPGGSKELARSLLQASGAAVEVKLGHELLNVEAGSEDGGVRLTMKVTFDKIGDAQKCDDSTAEGTTEEQSSSEVSYR